MLSVVSDGLHPTKDITLSLSEGKLNLKKKIVCSTSHNTSIVKTGAELRMYYSLLATYSFPDSSYDSYCQEHTLPFRPGETNKYFFHSLTSM